eukprot:XP_002259985.1 hypothetical protein, conserved in Plasmodium species [Plasmodium knowlesi strain H]
MSLRMCCLFRLSGFAKKKFFTSTREQNLEHKTQWLGNGVITDVYDKYEALKNVKEKSSLKSALKRFRDIVQRETKRKGYHFYAGWPPRNRIKITEDEKVSWVCMDVPCLSSTE